MLHNTIRSRCKVNIPSCTNCSSTDAASSGAAKLILAASYSGRGELALATSTRLPSDIQSLISLLKSYPASSPSINVVLLTDFDGLWRVLMKRDDGLSTPEVATQPERLGKNIRFGGAADLPPHDPHFNVEFKQPKGSPDKRKVRGNKRVTSFTFVAFTHPSALCYLLE